MNATINPVPVRKSVQVKAPPTRAFDIFTAGMSRWWVKSHSINPTKSPVKDVIVEPHVGGRWFERGEDGSECQWGKVLIWEPPARLVLAWQINAQFQFDPALVTEVEMRFTPDGAGTRVELEHRHLDRVGDQADRLRQTLDSPNGWGGLLESFSQQAA